MEALGVAIGGIPFVLALLLAPALAPSVAAHGVAVVGSREGDIVLGPAGTPQAYFHQFGLEALRGDLLHVEYVVTEPGGQAVSFSLHRHNSTGTLELLNVTEPSFREDLPAPDAGLYMPQWINPAAGNVSLHYSLYAARATGWDIVDTLEVAFFGAILGLATYGYLHGRRARGKAAPDAPGVGGGDKAEVERAPGAGVGGPPDGGPKSPGGGQPRG